MPYTLSYTKLPNIFESLSRLSLIYSTGFFSIHVPIIHCFHSRGFIVFLIYILGKSREIYANKFDNLGEMEKVLERHKLSKLNKKK